MIKLQNITKAYGENTIFDDVSYSFKKSKIKIKGENGVGKSVLLKLIVGYTLPNEGTVYYDTDKQLRKESDFLENAGISINAPEFMKNWSGMDNLLYLANINKKCNKAQILALAEAFDLKDSLSKKYKTYSLGMKQKLRLIQALMDEPRYVILDEPFDALDVNAKKKAMELLDAYLQHDAERMLIYTSHSEDDDVFADEIVHIKNHKLIIGENIQ